MLVNFEGITLLSELEVVGSNFELTILTLALPIVPFPQSALLEFASFLLS